jgi:archaellum component FlaC
MENSDSQNTLPNLQTVLDAIGGLRAEMNERFDKVEQRLTTVESRLTNVEARLTVVERRLTNVETDVQKVKEMQFVFENELDRLASANHQALMIAHENRADVRIIRKEVESWTVEMRQLQDRVA